LLDLEQSNEGWFIEYDMEYDTEADIILNEGDRSTALVHLDCLDCLDCLTSEHLDPFPLFDPSKGRLIEYDIEYDALDESEP